MGDAPKSPKVLHWAKHRLVRMPPQEVAHYRKVNALAPERAPGHAARKCGCGWLFEGPQEDLAKAEATHASDIRQQQEGWLQATLRVVFTYPQFEHTIEQSEPCPCVVEDDDGNETVNVDCTQCGGTGEIDTSFVKLVPHSSSAIEVGERAWWGLTGDEQHRMEELLAEALDLLLNAGSVDDHLNEFQQKHFDSHTPELQPPPPEPTEAERLEAVKTAARAALDAQKAHLEAKAALLEQTSDPAIVDKVLAMEIEDEAEPVSTPNRAERRAAARGSR